MAEIRSYMKEKEKRQDKKTDYKVKIRRHRFSMFLKVAAVILVVLVLLVMIVVQYKNHIYTSYDTIESVERQSADGMMDVRLGRSVLTYSKDGAHCTNLQGDVTWNQTYEIQDVLLDVCENVAVLAAYNGRDVYVVSDEKILGSFTTNLPIRFVATASSGRVVVVMADTNITYYNTYSAEGELLFEGQATMSGSGYPISISLSPNGELLQISYIYLDAGVQKTKVAFYNLGPVGANETDYLVSVKEYSDLLIPYVEFMNDNTAFAVGDSMLCLYKGSQKPVEFATFSYSKEVKSVYYNEEYIGLVFYSESGTALYEMQVYSADGKQVGGYQFSLDYSDIIFDEDLILVYSDSECLILNLDHVEKYSGSFAKPVRRMIPLRAAYKYLIVTADSLDTIQLK